MKIGIEHWIIGPQLIGFIFVIVGYIQRLYPPRKINPLYGYRMPSSMSSQEKWDAANHYAARYMIKAGAVLIITGIAIILALRSLKLAEDTFMLISATSLVVSSIAICVMLIVSTEKFLSRKFDNKL